MRPRERFTAYLEPRDSDSSARRDGPRPSSPTEDAEKTMIDVKVGVAMERTA